jgi:predicted nuclease of predicted toxin-antitoxin system
VAGLLFDQNLSDRLVSVFSDAFPGSTHTRLVGLSRADDLTVWQFARDRGLAIVTRDGDFHQMSFLYGAPPKVIWLRVGNCTTDAVIKVMRERAVIIADFVTSADESLLTISR